MGESAVLTGSFSHPSTASRESKEEFQGDPMRALTESISFGRFMSESLAWEKWSTFSHNRYLEEVEQFSKPGSVAQKKAFFEAHYKKRAAMKAAALLEEANDAAANNAPVIDTVAEAAEPLDKSPISSEATNKSSNEVIDKQQGIGNLDTELSHSADAIVEQQEIGHLAMDEAHFADVDASYPNESALYNNECLITSSVERGEEMTEQSVEVENATLVENSKQLENAGDFNMIPPTLKEKMANKGIALKESLDLPLPRNKRQMNCSPKQPSQSRASKLQKSSAKQADSRQPKTGTYVALNSTKPAVDLMDKRRLMLKSVNMSLNLGSQSGEAGKSSLRMLKDSFSTLRNATRASVNGVSRLLPSLAQKQPEDRRSKTLLNKPVSGGIISRGMAQTLSQDCSRFPSTSGSKVRSSIVSFPFSLKSEERAAKRKEFFQKLEVRNSTKEAEKQHQHKSEHNKKNALLRAKPSENLHQGSQSHQTNKIPLTRPRSPKLGRKPVPGVVHETSSRPPRRPSVSDRESSKLVGRKGNQITARSVYIPTKEESARECFTEHPAVSYQTGLHVRIRF